MRYHVIYAFALCSSIGATSVGCSGSSVSGPWPQVGGLNSSSPQRVHGGVNTAAYGASSTNGSGTAPATTPAAVKVDTSGSVDSDAAAGKADAAADDKADDKTDTDVKSDTEAGDGAAGTKPGGSGTAPATTP